MIAFQTGMLGVLALRSSSSGPPAVARAEPSPVAAPVVAPAPEVPRAAVSPPPPAPTPRPARSSASARARVVSEPAPDRLVEVEIVSEPAGATVQIGDQVGGTTPLAAYLPSGTTTIRFELEGYVAHTSRWSPRSGRRISAVLKPTP